MLTTEYYNRVLRNNFILQLLEDNYRATAAQQIC